MRLLLSTTKRINTSKWVCYSCRKHTSIRGVVTKVLHPPTPAEQLKRSIGPARTRFAPSPTGYLHLGSLRTALFNYLIAKATGGQFLLRIEDTDQKRTVPDAEERLFRDLEWAGIEWDEGPRVGGPYGPYHQSQRTALYRAHAEQLLESGHAYRCFCTSSELSAAAEFQVSKNLPPDYNRKCYHHVSKEQSDDRASKGEAHVIRLLSPDEPPVFNDIVYGHVRQPSKIKKQYLSKGLYDDAILMKTDGFPTYHLANVVDDYLMEITHVIRGSEWMTSTPKHLALYQAFGWEPPAFAHVALLLSEDRQKLSKRQASTNLDELRNQGIFPETLANFVALLGWSHGAGNDVMSLKELINNTSLKYTRGDVVVTPAKLWYLQKRHAARYASIAPADVTNPSHSLTDLALTPIMALLETASTTSPDQYPTYLTLSYALREPYIQTILYADAATMNYTTPQAFLSRNIYFLRAPTAAELENSFPRMKLKNVPARIVSAYDVGKLLRCMDQFAEIEEGNWEGGELRAWTEAIIEQSVVDSLRNNQDVDNKVGTKTEPKPENVLFKANTAENPDGIANGDLREEHEEVDENVKLMVRKAWAKAVHGYIRWAIVGGMPGPDGAETMRILGRRECLERLELAREVVIGRLENEGAGSLDG